MATESATSTLSYEDSLSSQYLTSSISSLSSARAQTSWIARTYRQAAQLFLTRRLYEALSTIEPLLSLPKTDEHAGPTNGVKAQVDGQTYAPIAAASRTTRVKVWSFYLTLLNSIIELGPEEGKLVFGSAQWRSLAAKAREGSVWDEVVQIGYGADEGAVDGDVVVNLATLLLTHMPSQKLNQHKLETYLSAASNPTYDLTAHLENSQSSIRNPNQSGGTSTPRDLNTRLKLLELYTLHVLPQTGEWDYAHDFINMSEVLDEERRDAFQNALQMLREEKDHDAIREKELRRRQEEEMQQRQQEEEKRRRDEIRQNEEKTQRAAEEKRRSTSSKPAPTSRDGGIPSPAPSKAQPDATNQAKKNIGAKGRGPAKRPPVPPPPPGIYRRATSMLSLMQNSILNMRQSVTKNPMAMFRFLLFLLAFALAFGRRDVRERIRRTVDDGWNRMRRTIGMGVKVSYI